MINNIIKTIQFLI